MWYIHLHEWVEKVLCVESPPLVPSFFFSSLFFFDLILRLPSMPFWLSLPVARMLDAKVVGQQ